MALSAVPSFRNPSRHSEVARWFVINLGMASFETDTDDDRVLDELRQQLPHIRLMDQMWVERLAEKEAAIESFVLH